MSQPLVTAVVTASIALVPSWLLLFGLASELSTGWLLRWPVRTRIVAASTAWSAIAVALTESLGLAEQLHHGALRWAWGVTALLLGCVYVALKRRGAARSRAVDSSAPAVSSPQRSPRSTVTPLTPPEAVMLALLVLQAGVLLIVALAYPPNNVDSINYHVARVMHWEQQRSVDFYASSVMMQNRGAPFAEYLITHLMVLSGNDRLANLVQWFAMILSAVSVSLIAGFLGCRRSGQIAAAVLCCSLPMGILQSTSTQNDYVAAAWCAAFVTLGMTLARTSPSLGVAVLTGLALGLAILTKLTTLAYLPGFCVVLALDLARRMRWRAAAAGLALAICVVAINAGFVSRMFALYGSPFGPSAGLANTRISLGGAASNLIRSAALHAPLAIDIWPIPEFNSHALGVLKSLHDSLGLDPLDPDTSLVPVDAFLTRPSRHEDVAGNPFHLWLAILASAVVAFRFLRKRVDGSKRTGVASWAASPGAYLACLVVGVVFFNAYFKWQPWHSRLQLPAFVLMAPLIATILFGSDRQWRQWVVVAIALLGFHWVFGNATRPLNMALLQGRTARDSAYFINRPALFPVHQRVTDTLRRSGCDRVGLHIGSAPFEYPLWALLGADRHRMTIRHIHVPSETGVYAPADFEPCAIVTTGDQPAWKGTPFELPAHYRERWIVQRHGAYEVLLDPSFSRR